MWETEVLLYEQELAGENIILAYTNLIRPKKWHEKIIHFIQAIKQIRTMMARTLDIKRIQVENMYSLLLQKRLNSQTVQ